MIYSHFFLLIILCVSYSLKCSRFHFSTPLSASHYLNNLLHLSIHYVATPPTPHPLSNSSSPSVCLAPAWPTVLNSPLLSSLSWTTRWWSCQRLHRAEKKRPMRCAERNGGMKLERRCERYRDGEENARVRRMRRKGDALRGWVWRRQIMSPLLLYASIIVWWFLRADVCVGVHIFSCADLRVWLCAPVYVGVKE